MTVLELAPVIMGRQLDEPAAELLKKISEAQDIEIRTGVKIASIEGDDFVSGIRMEDGQVLPVDMVVVSCGVRANTAVAKEAGLEVDRSVVVNARMETSMEDIYACGDCAQYQGSIMDCGVKLWNRARQPEPMRQVIIWNMRPYQRH